MESIFIVTLALLLGYFMGYRHKAMLQHDSDDVEISPLHKKRNKPEHNVKANISGEEITIRYKDSKGIETERPIRVLNIGETKNGKLSIIAFCFLRENIRAFLVDRIISVVDSDGVVHDPHQFFDKIYSKALAAV